MLRPSSNSSVLTSMGLSRNPQIKRNSVMPQLAKSAYLQPNWVIRRLERVAESQIILTLAKDKNKTQKVWNCLIFRPVALQDMHFQKISRYRNRWILFWRSTLVCLINVSNTRMLFSEISTQHAFIRYNTHRGSQKVWKLLLFCCCCYFHMFLIFSHLPHTIQPIHTPKEAFYNDRP